MQIVKSKLNNGTNVRLIVLTALFSALIAVTTVFIKIPTLFGYVHAGDSMIYLAASVLPSPFGIIAAAVGGGLSDLISGYPHWIIPSAIIKSLNAVPFVIARVVLIKKEKNARIINPINLAALVPTSLVTVFGYFFAHFFMYDWAAAVAGLATEWIQPTVGALIFIILGIGLDQIKFKNKILKIL